jgi:sirohydrochlorin cobaltochelatase
MKRAIVLIGHGGVPKDYPRDRLTRLRTMEARRVALGGTPSEDERMLDAEIRSWPRTPESDPYQAGLEALAERIRARLDSTPLQLAYNEFCGPSIEEAVGNLIETGHTDIVLLSSMFTPGGSHSEIEIPDTVASLQARHPQVRLRYLWPYDLSLIAGVILDHVLLAEVAP